MSRIQIETIEVKNRNRQQLNSTMKSRSQEEIVDWLESGFKKRIGIKFCIKCGNEMPDDNKIETNEINTINTNCSNCGNDTFLEGYLASLVGGYIEMSKNGELRKYYNRVMRNRGSIVKLNEKRSIMNLLIHKDRANVSQEVVYKIYNKFS